MVPSNFVELTLLSFTLFIVILFLKIIIQTKSNSVLPSASELSVKFLNNNNTNPNIVVRKEYLNINAGRMVDNLLQTNVFYLIQLFSFFL